MESDGRENVSIKGGLRTPDNDPELAARREKAVRLRVAGFTFEKVGQALGVSKQRAHALIMDEVRKSNEECHESTTMLRDIAHRRLENAINRLTTAAFPNPTEEDRRAKRVPEPNLQALDRLLKAIDQDAKIMGYEAPQKHQIDMRVVAASLTPLVDTMLTFIPDEKRADAYQMVEQQLAALQSSKRAG